MDYSCFWTWTGCKVLQVGTRRALGSKLIIAIVTFPFPITLPCCQTVNRGNIGGELHQICMCPFGYHIKIDVSYLVFCPDIHQQLPTTDSQMYLFYTFRLFFFFSLCSSKMIVIFFPHSLRKSNSSAAITSSC